MYPVLLEFGSVKLLSYPLLVGMSWGLAYIACLKVYPERGAHGLFWGAFLASWVGSKTLFLFSLFLGQDQKWGFLLTSLNFWMGGGFVFYGGFLFGSLHVLCYGVWLKKIPSGRLHLLLPALVWGHAIGRMGCFLAGCCYGSVCTLPWKVYLNGEYRHPVSLYEAAWLVCLGLILSRLLIKKTSSPKIISTYLIGYAGGRFFLEFFRGDSIRGMFFYLSSSQLISLAITFLTFTYILWEILTRSKTD